MTQKQRDVLDWFYANRIGATPFQGDWVWPQDIRDNPELAERLWQKIDLESRIKVRS